MTVWTTAQLPFPALTATLKAAAEATRLRLLMLIADAELTVTDLTAILRQSQPRLSRHLRLLAEAGLVERHREGSWAFFRLGEAGGAADIARDPDRPARSERCDRCARPRAAGCSPRGARRRGAKLFSPSRRGMGPYPQTACDRRGGRRGYPRVLGDQPIRSLLDLGTGTGRMLELFADDIERGLGLDLSLDMLALARTRLDRAGLKHCTVRQGDIYDLALPRDTFDVVIIHQVLHFLDDSARAIREAARVLRPGGRLLVIDFAPHDLEFLRDEHAHRRLGFAAETVTQWLEAAGLDLLRQQTLPPGPEGKIAVSLWLARDPRLVIASPANREVA